MAAGTQLLIDDLKMFDCDHEFYPTTLEIIEAMHKDMVSTVDDNFSLMDLGAGNGKIFTELKRLGHEQTDNIGSKTIPTDCYAIEKSPILLEELPDDVYVVGTDMFSNTIIDKRVDVIYTNPPYKIYEEWLYKALREANCNYLYFAVPKRWQKSALISSAMEDRKASFEIIGSYDFQSAEDRAARAKVDLVRVDFGKTVRGYNASQPHVDPFELWFNENFKQDEDSEDDKKAKAKEAKAKAKEQKTELISTLGLVDALVALYEKEMAHLLDNYQKIMSIDTELLTEVGVSHENVLGSLKLKIEGLKHRYWEEMFSKFDKLTSRLTTASRRDMLNRLMAHTKVGFNASNIHAILGWAIKNANKYYDTQLVDTFTKMLTKANTTNYKSNKRVFSDNDWRYNHAEFRKNVSHVRLDLRIVLENLGGLKLNWLNGNIEGLSETSSDFVNDLTTLANNLGFTCEDKAHHFDWSEKGSKVFYYTDPKTHKEKVLMTVKAFKNRNVHIKFSQAFILALNVEMARLKKWVQNPAEASEEMDVPLKEVCKYFNMNYTVLPSQARLLLLAARN